MSQRLKQLVPVVRQFPELGLTDYKQFIELISLELGDPDLLKRWGRHGSQRTRILPPRLIYVICSHNLPLSAWQVIVRGLVLGAKLIVKSSQTQHEAICRFVEALPNALKELVNVRPTHSSRAMRQADVVIVFGNNETICAVQETLAPHQKLIAYGPQVSLIWLGELRQVGSNLLHRVARDVCTYNQLGCLSPQMILLDPTTSLTSFCGQLADHLQRWPQMKTSHSEAFLSATLVREIRASYPRARVWQPIDGSTQWTILQHAQPGMALSCGYRCIHVFPVPLEQLHRALRPIQGQISTVGHPVGRLSPQLINAFVELGAKRFCPVGRMQFPSHLWHHDGRPQLADLVKWLDDES